MATTGKKHNTLLVFWLAFMFLVNLATALSYLFFSSTFASLYPKLPFWIFYAYAFGAFANVAFTVLLFKWKKWAFFGICGMAAIFFVLNIALFSAGITSTIGLLGPIVLYIFLKPQWSLLE